MSTQAHNQLGHHLFCAHSPQWAHLTFAMGTSAIMIQFTLTQAVQLQAVS
jgi:hypothetical protein